MPAADADSLGDAPRSTQRRQGRSPRCRGTPSRGGASQLRPEMQAAGSLPRSPARGRTTSTAECHRQVDRAGGADQGDPVRSGGPRAASAAAESSAGFRPFRHSRPPRCPRPNGIACDALRAGLRVERAIDAAVQTIWANGSFRSPARDLLSIADLTTDEIIAVLDLADAAKIGAGSRQPACRADRLRSSSSDRATAPACPSRFAIHRLGGPPDRASSTPRSSSAEP